MQKGDELGCMMSSSEFSCPDICVSQDIAARNGEDMVEDIIRHMALFGADRKLWPSGWRMNMGNGCPKRIALTCYATGINSKSGATCREHF